MTLCVYIGAGCHFPHCDFSTLVCMDSLPNTEYGTFIPYDPSFRQNDFFERLVRNYKRFGFTLVSDEKDHYWRFENGDRKIFYYHDISFPDSLTDAIKDKISGFDTLVVSGYCPNKVIMDYTTKQIDFYGNNMTVYLCNVNELEYEIDYYVDYYLYDNQHRVKKWYLQKEDYNEKHRVYDYLGDTKTFDNMIDFVNESRNW